jgi:hypothetical protein
MVIRLGRYVAAPPERKNAIAAAFHPVFADDTTVKFAACAEETDRMYASTVLLVSLLIVPLVPCTQGLLVALISPEPAEGSGVAARYTKEPAFVGFSAGVLMGVVPVDVVPCKALSKVAEPPV